jgi:hypothetical protein
MHGAPNVQDAVIAECFVDILSFSELRDKDIHKMVKTINHTPAAAPVIVATPNPPIIPLVPQV